MRTPVRLLLDLLVPVRCAGCDVPDVAWCPACAMVLRAPFPVDRPATAHGPPVYALGRYRGPARRAVLGHKERGRRDLTAPLGRALGAALPLLPAARAGPGGVWYLVPAPSRPVAARRRGGPHMLALARQCAAALALAGQPAAVAPALRMDRRARDSVGLDAAARAANLRGRLRHVPAGSPPAGQPVVLLDDVITTGATAAACTSVLATAGVPVAAVLTLTATA
ncbi:MAG TPA: ComF family protein [Actinophytocola sp.]|uniref:ComF family protein n=1 Tax=Actinophytocola sp. TaxID=1872138 RepID=UPI002DBB0067|nr:ComF family protein [Actinophytocola sp.]HEU5475915.1 ComF family protein [Actinophytocola sp.]